APLGSNLQTLIDSGLIDLASLVSNIDTRTVTISGLIEDLQILSGLTGSLDDLGAVGSNLQALIDSGLINLGTTVSNIDQRTIAISSLVADLEVLGLLTGSLDDLGALGSNLQALVDSGLVDIATLVSNIDVRTLSISNLLGDLDVLDLLTGSLDEIASLSSSLLEITETGITDLSSNVQSIVSQLQGLDVLPAITGRLDDLAGLVTALQELVNEGLGELGTSITNIDARTIAITSALEVLDSFSTIIDELTNVAATVAALDVSSLTNVDTIVTALDAIKASTDGLDASEITDILGFVTTIDGQVADIDWANITEILDSVGTLETGNADLIRGTSNLVAFLRGLMGEDGDASTDPTVFGGLRKLEELIDPVASEISSVAGDSRQAKVQASAAASGINELRDALGRGEVEQALNILDRIAKDMQGVSDIVGNIRDHITTDDLVAMIRDTNAQVVQMAGEMGIQKDLVNAVDTLNVDQKSGADQLEGLQSQIDKLRASMELMYVLLDKSVNQPKVVEVLTRAE
ncbi:MAG TPA: hypothetical protein DIC52_22545, partial [Candidatus Latescibacteria bacterium]|nr:hypothetical protein [Candidatus Latescibacterota bacterium]